MYCKNCKKHPGNTFPKKLILILKKKIKGNSKCVIHKIEDKYDIESELEIYLQFFTDWCYESNM